MLDPERAPIVRRGFEDYATGRFTQAADPRAGDDLRPAESPGSAPLSSQAIGMLLRNQLYAGIVDVPEYGVRDKRGDFEPLISEELFYRAQAVLSGPRCPSAGAEACAVIPTSRCAASSVAPTCGRGLTGSWSKGRSEYYAYYHCRPGCRGVNVTKVKLETLFADELARLQPSPGYMRLLKDSVLRSGRRARPSVRADLAHAERTAEAIQKKLDRLDEAFLFQRSIDIDDLRPARREAARGAHAGADRPSTPQSSMNSTWRASWRSQSAFCRGPPTSGCRPRSTSGSGSNSCSFRREWRSTASGFVGTARNRAGLQLLARDSSLGRMKGWWT